MSAMTTILAIGAHPDDIEIGMGSTIHGALRAGHRVVGVDLTDGEPTPRGSREIRTHETARANEILGLTERICLELPNRVLADSEDARRRLAAVMRRVRPDLVVTHHTHDAHPDHVAAHTITRGAVLLSRIVKIDLEGEPWRPGKALCFDCSHEKSVREPSFVVAVPPEDFDAKMAAILAYESQFGPVYDGLHWMRDVITARARMLGALINSPFGEAFFSDDVVGLDSLWQIRGRGEPNQIH